MIAMYVCMYVCRRELSEECLLPELVELLNDEENRVRVCALESLAELTSSWSEQCLKTQVLPLVRGFCDTVIKQEDYVLIEGVARMLGRLCYDMRGKG